MQFVKIYKITLVFFVISLYLTHPLLARAGAKQTTLWLNAPVTIRFQEKPLSGVLKELSRQTDIAILYDENLANERVTGNFKNVKASDAINRLFSKKNKSIQVSKDKKVIIVKTFGAKNFIWAYNNDRIGDQGLLKLMTLKDLGRLHTEQYKEYKKYIANDNQMLEDGSMTRGELRAMHKQQQREFQIQLANDSEMLQGGSMTRGELKAMHKQQQQEFQVQLANDNEMLQGGSMTRGELRAMHKRQQKKFQAKVVNNAEMLEVNNMTRAELKAMHERQQQTFEDIVKNGEFKVK